MVLDSRVMDWAGQQGLDSAALKKAKVPIYGKWYFPDLPANEPLRNLSTGEIETFPPGYRAGAVLYVKDADLKQAGVGPYKAAAPVAPAAAPAPAAAAPSRAAEPVAAAAVATAPASAMAPEPSPPPAPRPAPSAAGSGHESATHQETRMDTAHALGHAAPLRGHPVEHAHPGSRTYIVIALILAVITAVEVAVYYLPELRAWLPLILGILSVTKFVMVVGYFMHLKFDHTSFTWYFGGGLVLALAMSMSVVVLQIATHGLPPGDGNAHVYPSTLGPGGGPGGVAPGSSTGGATTSAGH